jgi:hypothetical protein
MRTYLVVATILTLGCGNTPSRPGPVDPGVPPDIRGTWASSVLSDGATIELSITAATPTIAGRGLLFTRVYSNTGPVPGPVLPIIATGESHLGPLIVDLTYSVGVATSLLRFEVASADSLELQGTLHHVGGYAEAIFFMRQ